MNVIKEKQALIFDIRRFSTHDGNGIRTNIFFKGCSLRCVWCQNPEGLLLKQQPVWFENNCIGCGSCLKSAQNGGVTLAGVADGYADAISGKASADGVMYTANGKADRSFRILPHGDVDDCWEDILDACPTGALRLDSRYYTMEEILHEVEKDRIFMDMGGGVTLSGGEPLVQYGFAAELLQRLQELGIHTAMETALNVSQAAVAAVYPYLNQFYADLKIYDGNQHKKYTGADNRQILANLRYILTGEHRDRVIIRTPMIPGMTAMEKNIRQIAGYIYGLYPDVKYELLNYNPLAQAKYPMAGREYCFKDTPQRYTEIEMEHFRQIARAAGIKSVS